MFSKICRNKVDTVPVSMAIQRTRDPHNRPLPARPLSPATAAPQFDTDRLDPIRQVISGRSLESLPLNERQAQPLQEPAALSPLVQYLVQQSNPFRYGAVQFGESLENCVADEIIQRNQNAFYPDVVRQSQQQSTANDLLYGGNEGDRVDEDNAEDNGAYNSGVGDGDGGGEGECDGSGSGSGGNRATIYQNNYDDYEEIGEITAGMSNLAVTGNNSYRNPIDQRTAVVESHTNTIWDMGQGLSLRKPQISFTWVLRDQKTPNVSATATATAAAAATATANCNVNGNGISTGISSATVSGSGSGYGWSGKRRGRLFSVEHYENNNAVGTANATATAGDEIERISDLDTIVVPMDEAGGKPLLDAHRLQNMMVRGSVRATGRKSLLVRRTRSKSEKSVKQMMCDNADNTPKAVAAKKAGDLLSSTYSEPTLYVPATVASQSQRRHKHRRRRDHHRDHRDHRDQRDHRAPCFGYEIKNVEDFLSKCSLSFPANIPMVLSSASTLFQTRPGGYQIEIALPLGMVVNAVFKNLGWLYVQTPHAEEGYVDYTTCLPLGILPQYKSSTTSRPKPCWETSGDVFPRPCGNMTDSEKEVHLRGGTRSEGERTPRCQRSSTTKNERTATSSAYGERQLDLLYLRAASQNRSLADRTLVAAQAYAQHKSNTHTCPDDYVLLQHRSNNLNNTVAQAKRGEPTKNKLMSSQTPAVLRQLVAITDSYSSEAISVRKGDVVTLLACKEYPNKDTWFYVKARDGCEGYIPAQTAGNGFL